MTLIHLPEDIGDTAAKVGVKPISESYSFALASDELVGYAGVFAPTNDAEKLNPIFKPASDNTTDVFALSRLIKSQVLFRNVSRYDIEPNQWSYQLADTTDNGTLPQGSESIIWTERTNTRASYPGSVTEVKFLPDNSAIQIRNNPVSSKIGYQQTVLYSNRVFSASTSPILVTVAVSMTLSDNPNCSKSWGLFGGNSGYFFRIYGTGLVDNFKVGYRRTLGGTIAETEIPRSQFNGDKLDGTTGHTQTFTNVGMFGIEIGTAGYGARFWAYVTIGNTARWVLVHSMNDDSGNSQDRITDEESLPIAFEVKNVGQSTTLQTLSKYGTSVTSLGAVLGTPDINSISAVKTIFTSKSVLPILGIKVRDYINNKKNFNSILGTKLNILISSGRWEIIIVENPVATTQTWLNINSLSTFQYNTTRTTALTGGIQLCQYIASANKPLSIKLSDIFALNRAFLTAQYTNDAQAQGDFGQQFLISSDEIWICAVEANIPINNNEIIWDTSSFIFTSVTHEFALSATIPRSTTINATLNILEV